MTAPLAAELGRLAAPSRGSRYDDVRQSLLDAIIAAKAAGRLDQEAWATAFGDAARSLRMRVLAAAESDVLAATRRARLPARRVRALLPDAESADTLLHRMLAEGIPLERFEGLADDPVTRRARAAALEMSWDGAVRVASAERARWHAVAACAAEWRRPTGPLWALSLLLLLGSAIVAAWLSGSVASPGWFRPINDLWWRMWP